MALINILNPHVADLIAAGEVVERPASVIKELVENSFDAGARNVTVEIRHGGSIYIRVTDDGCGMSPEDAGIAFMRHATSKLHTEQDLEAIGTMGFRGEALAAISSVSRIELLTRRPEDASGVRVTVEASDLQDIVPAGCPAGTAMVIRDLFFNTPARLKFMKSDRSEASACRLAALRCALARPDVALRFICDGKEDFFSPGDGKLDSCVYALLGRDTFTAMLSCDGENGDLQITGFLSAPSAVRGNRSQQFFFCNGRFIRSVLLQTALEQAYRNCLLAGHYPSCVLYLTLPGNQVDVNVHPAKTEVKFTDERAAFNLVYHAAQSALAGGDGAPEVKPSSALAAPFGQNQPVSGDSGQFPTEQRPTGYSVSPSPASSGTLHAPRPVSDYNPDPESRPQNGLIASSPKSAASPLPASTPSGFHPLQTEPSLFPAETITYEQQQLPMPTGRSTPVEPAVPDTAAQNVENPVQNVENFPTVHHKIMGEVMKTYILVESEGNLLMIDKHAAHERMIFDRLKSQHREIAPQMLLAPVPVRLSAADAELLEGSGELLLSLGFEIEPFGVGQFLVRAVPADMDPEGVVAALDEICDALRYGNAPDPEAASDEILHTIACKAAIKAGWDTDPRELERLVQAVVSGSVRYCPHGRPVSVTLTRRDLDKMFRRIV